MLAHLVIPFVLLGGPHPAEALEAPMRYFQDCPTRTGGHATIIIPATPAVDWESGQLEPGDEIAALTPTGECAGAVVWTGKGTAITLWEDDPFTPVLDGFRSGDPLSFEVYDMSEGTVQTSTAVVIEAAYGSTEAFTPDALFIVGARPTTVEEGPQSDALRVRESYPNPFRASTSLPVTVGHSGRLTLDVFDALGRHVAQPFHQDVEAGEHRLQIEVPDLAPGVYVYRVGLGAATAQGTFTVAR